MYQKCWKCGYAVHFSHSPGEFCPHCGNIRLQSVADERTEIYPMISLACPNDKKCKWTKKGWPPNGDSKKENEFENYSHCPRCGKKLKKTVEK